MRTGKQGTVRVRFDNDGCPSVPKLTRAILQLILSKFMMKMGVETPRGLSRKIHARIWRPLSGTRSVCYLSHPSLMEGPPTLFSFAKSSLLCSNHGQGTFPSVTSRQKNDLDLLSNKRQGEEGLIPPDLHVPGCSFLPKAVLEHELPVAPLKIMRERRHRKVCQPAKGSAADPLVVVSELQEDQVQQLCAVENRNDLL
jgi:hypothetical protein